MNLIGNAVKFSPSGSTVHVGCQRRGDDVLFTVKDRGSGIPDQKLETIFERFEQVDSSQSRGNGGTGLGLAICRSIVEQHGGRIWALSTPGEGSMLSFVVPAARRSGDAGQPFPDRGPELRQSAPTTNETSRDREAGAEVEQRVAVFAGSQLPQEEDTP